ncbi:MAG TPA: SRPBCC family protein [Nocardioidaceae bacterium]|nr:SRPBCC family protein [Nocardioidaceae bacterium]
MGIDVSATADITKPADVVAAYAMEAENDPTWIGGISSARRLTPGPTAVGTRVERVAHFIGWRIDYVMEVADLAPGRRIVLRSIKSPFPMRVTYSFEPVAGGTRAGVRVEGGPEGLARPASGMMSRAVRRNLRKDVARLKAICETHA